MTFLAICAMLIYAFVGVEGKTEIEVVSFIGAACVLLSGSVLASIYKSFIKRDISIFRMALLLASVGVVTAFSYGAEAGAESMFAVPMFDYFIGIVCAMGGCVLSYLIVRFSNIHRFRILGLLCVVGMPVILLLTRVLGTAKDGAYLSIAGSFLTIGFMILMAPFAIAYCFSVNLELPQEWGRKVTSLPLNQLMLLGCILISALLAGCLNNEYGTVLLICGSASFMFLMYGRNLSSKVMYSVLCMLGIIVCACLSVKLKYRINVWLDLEGAMASPNVNLLMEAQPIGYIYQTISHYGWWGVGKGELSRALFKLYDSDYAISTLLYNNGIIFTLLVFLVGIILISKVMKVNTECRYDRYVVSAIGVILLVMLLLGAGGNIGLLPLTGIGFPFVAQAKSINFALFSLIGIVIAIQEKGDKL